MRYTGLQQPVNRAPKPVILPPIETEYKPERITTKTVLASLEQASEQLKEKGISYHPATIRRYCRTSRLRRKLTSYF